MLNKQAIYRLLDEESIWHEITEHPAAYNMADLAAIPLPYPSADAKNLFVRDDNKRNYYLLTVRGDRRVDLRAAEQIGPLAFWGIHRNSHQRIIFSSDSTRISSAPIALSCSILLHSSRSLITTCIELQPSCASGRIVGLFMPGRMRTASGIFA